jgi:hypothetical protein
LTSPEDGVLTSQSFKNQYTSPAKYRAPELSPLFSGDENSYFQWSFSLTVAVIIVGIVSYIGLRHVYKKFVSKTLLQDQEYEA